MKIIVVSVIGEMALLTMDRRPSIVDNPNDINFTFRSYNSRSNWWRQRLLVASKQQYE